MKGEGVCGRPWEGTRFEPCALAVVQILGLRVGIRVPFQELLIPCNPQLAGIGYVQAVCIRSHFFSLKYKYYHIDIGSLNRYPKT